MERPAGKFLFITILTTEKNGIRYSKWKREPEKKPRYLALFASISQNGRVTRWRLVAMVKESLISILKETSCYVVISNGRNFVARRYLRDWNYARGADHRYSDALGEKGLLRRSGRDETCHLR